MRCDEFELRLHERLDQRASLIDDVDLNQHCQHCRACRSWRDAMLTLADGVELLVEPTAPALASRVASAVLQAKSWQVRRRRMLMATPLVVLLMLASWAWHAAPPLTSPSQPDVVPQLAATTEPPQPLTSDEDALQLLASLSNWNVPWFGSSSPTEPPADDTASATAPPLGLEPLTRSATEAFDMLWRGLPTGGEEPRS